MFPLAFDIRYNYQMSYQVYTTEAIVCGSFNSGTADKSYLLFTRSAGMLYATARSVREERSRQRYALQDFSHITVSLVQGKSGWRIGSVDTKSNFFVTAESRELRGSVVRIIKYLRRYVQGEEAHFDLFDDVLTGLQVVSGGNVVNVMLYEQFFMVRMLHLLGYVAVPTKHLAVFGTPLNQLTGIEYGPAVLDCEALITTAQSVSHL